MHAVTISFPVSIAHPSTTICNGRLILYQIPAISVGIRDVSHAILPVLSIFECSGSPYPPRAYTLLSYQKRSNNYSAFPGAPLLCGASAFCPRAMNTLAPFGSELETSLLGFISTDSAKTITRGARLTHWGFPVWRQLLSHISLRPAVRALPAISLKL